MKGEVIGVTAAQLTGGQNLNFAIPVNYVIPLLSYSSPKPLAQYATTKTNATTNAPTPPSQDKLNLAPWLGGDVTPPQPTRWKMEVRDGILWGSAERLDTACFALAKEQVNNPSPNWNGCGLGFSGSARFTKVYMASFSVPAYMLNVSIIPHYTDSERIDMTVTVEQTNHTYRTYVRKDVPIVLLGNVLEASADFMIPYDPVSVPTVDATEKGGKREVTHSYR
jgi:hypothetical protein